jgi:UDP-N-acetylglucosamine 2-epimerase
VGARPQFIKAAPVSKALRAAGVREFLVHTGQHYDTRMSQIFFDELGIPDPDVNLGVGSGTHAQQTGTMLIGLEEVMLRERPDWVLVYGDTNSTLAGALAASKLRLPLAHVEAGLRSFNRAMPEEHNRVLTDHCADRLFCPTQTAVDNLAREGITKEVYFVGDTMYDAVLTFGKIARERSTILRELGLERKGYLLATLHRPYNTDVPASLTNIITALREIDEPIVFPVHPRTRQRLADLKGAARISADWNQIHLIDPVGYLDMLMLEENARLVLTDSGGIQKEAYFFGVPCLTLRPETEWIETVESGWNTLVGADREQIATKVRNGEPPSVTPPPVFGDGRSADQIVFHLSPERQVHG